MPTRSESAKCAAQRLGERERYYGFGFAWGSTNFREDYATIAPLICAGELSVGSSPLPSSTAAFGCSDTKPSTRDDRARAAPRFRYWFTRVMN